MIKRVFKSIPSWEQLRMLFGLEIRFCKSPNMLKQKNKIKKIIFDCWMMLVEKISVQI